MIGPSEENLARLAKMLPTMADGVIAGAIGGKGKPVHYWPRFQCPACRDRWGKPYILSDKDPEQRTCNACRKVLKKGATIFITEGDKRYFVLRSKAGGVQINPEFRGKILKVPKSYMDRLAINFALASSPEFWDGVRRPESENQ